MTLEYLRNQAKAGLLDEVPASRELGLRMLQTARTRLKDAGIAQASSETRSSTVVRTRAFVPWGRPAGASHGVDREHQAHPGRR